MWCSVRGSADAIFGGISGFLCWGGEIQTIQQSGGLHVAVDGHPAAARARKGSLRVTLQGPDKQNTIMRAALVVLTGEYDHARAAIDALVQAHDASTSIGALPYDSIPSSKAVHARISTIQSTEGMEELLKSNELHRTRGVDGLWGGLEPPSRDIPVLI